MKNFSIEKSLKNAFYVLFGFVFVWLIINVLFYNVYFDYNPAMSLSIGAVWFAFFAVIAISGIYGIRNKKREFFTRQTAALGMFLFLLLWEAGTRYLLNYYPIFIISSLPAMTDIMEKINIITVKKEKQLQ